MKMQAQHYDDIRTAIAKHTLATTTVRERIAAYQGKPGIKDATLAAMWQVLDQSKVHGDSVRYVTEVLYTYLNDKHISNALRAIAAELQV